METLNLDIDIDNEKAISEILPEHLVEKIIAMMPFPSVLKVGVLSKSLQARLSPISSLNGEESKRLATGFQRQHLVADWSNNFGTFYPVCTTGKDLIGYDQASRKLSDMAYRTRRCVKEQQLVENSLTREWKQLLWLPEDCENYVTSVKLLADTISDTYKVIIFSRYDPRDDEKTDEFRDDLFYLDFVHIYHSKSETGNSILRWNFHTILGLGCVWLNIKSIAFLDGVLYMLHDDSDVFEFWKFLWSFHVETRMWKDLYCPATTK